MKHTYLFLVAIIIVVFSACTKSNPDVVLKSITFGKDSVIVLQHSSMQLNPVFTPKAFDAIPVEWTSSNTSVVTVSPTGTVYAAGAGKAWIIIKDKNSATSGKMKFIVN